jgi:hypothetical protein
MFLIAMKRITSSEAILFIRVRRPIAFFTGVNFRSSIESFERDYRAAINNPRTPRPKDSEV